MSMRVSSALVAALMLASCGPSPFATPDDGGDGGTPDTAVGSVYGAALNDQLTANSIVYDATNDEIVVNNIPFDGATGTNGQAQYVRTGSLPGSFGRYENSAGAFDYYAVFRRSASGAVEAGAFGTARYVDFGIGGAGAKRLATSVTLPDSGEYTFTGEYAAVRVFDSASGINVPQYVTGTASINVDFGDIDVVGTILGTVSNRTVYDSNGTALGAMDDFISLAGGTIDRATGTVAGGGANGRELAGGAVTSTGDWSAVFGSGGNEIAGIVVIEGAADDPGGTGNMRETGVIIAMR